ncbi:kinase-like protein [Auricularia subglabra TFB-10046 SS5]|nr:kinase-like protein [Auricularia subglabra TFB-10046 SS5]
MNPYTPTARAHYVSPAPDIRKTDDDGPDVPLEMEALRRFWALKRHLPRHLSVACFDQPLLLGRGAHAAVVRLTLHGTNHVYALKGVEHPEVAMREEAISKLVDENHVPFVAGVLAYFMERHVPVMVMEVAAHGDLYSVLEHTKQFSAEETFRWVVELTAGISALHRIGIIHRDLHPGNILMDAEHHVRIADFGLAYCAPLDDAVSWQLNGYISPQYHIVGAADYRAPEMILGTGYNERVDYWALGLVLYELATGTHPFSDSKGVVDPLKIIREEPDAPKWVVQEHGIHFLHLLYLLLEKDPAKRLHDGNIKSHPYFHGVRWDLFQGPFCNTAAILSIDDTATIDCSESVSSTSTDDITCADWHEMNRVPRAAIPPPMPPPPAWKPAAAAPVPPPFSRWQTAVAALRPAPRGLPPKPTSIKQKLKAWRNRLASRSTLSLFRQ